MSRDNWLGLAGLLVLSLGAILFVAPAHMLPWWSEWVVGPLLWYTGAGMVFAHIMARLSGSGRGRAQARDAAKKKVTG